MTDIDRIHRLHPERGDVLLVHLDGEPDEGTDEQLTDALGEVAQTYGATIIVMPAGVRLEELDDREMARAGWVRVTDEVAAEIADGAVRRAVVAS